jgi:cytochrome c-type biogenesis protein CcmH
MMRIFFMAFLALLASQGTARAVRPDEMLANPALEKRAEDIGRSLRCLVCQNESIEDSEAPLAHDLRVLVRKKLAAGDSDAQVIRFIVGRYGNYVLLKPPFDAETYALWLGHVVLLIAGSAGVILFYRKREKS